jgi:hypothetical protein
MSMMSLSELYFSIFVVFFRLSRWSGTMKVRTASTGVTVVEAALVVGALAAVSRLFRSHLVFNPWVLALGLLALASLTDYILVYNGRGVAFDERFRTFSGGRRIVLFVAAIAVMLASGAFFYLSMSYYLGDPPFQQ